MDACAGWTTRTRTGTAPTARYTDDSGCGNDIDPSRREIRRLVLEALQRYADLGIDGFRFDLASLLTRDGGQLVRRIGDWAERAGRVLVAEPWDLACYQVGDAFPDDRWLQWNDRFRDDVRGFLRGEPGMVPAMVQRVSGSPDLFGAAPRRTRQLPDRARRADHARPDGGHERSAPVMGLRARAAAAAAANAFCLLLLSAGAAMFVMGDEFARTQHGHDNPYNVDSELTWVDWNATRGVARAARRWCADCSTLRRRADFDDVRCYGTDGAPDLGHESRSLAWCTGDLTVMANMWWEPLRVRACPSRGRGRWRWQPRRVATFDGDRVGRAGPVDGRPRPTASPDPRRSTR